MKFAFLFFLLASFGCAHGGAAAVPADELLSRITSRSYQRTSYVKNSPIYAYRIDGDVPRVIQAHLGAVDSTAYTLEYLTANRGSVFALQMDGARPDFYLIGLATFQADYEIVDRKEILLRNARYNERFLAVDEIDTILKSTNLIAVLKTRPVELIRMSDLGYAIEDAITIDSPWGEQTKPAGQDAFLAQNSEGRYYMINAGADGLPLGYVPTQE